MSDASRPRLIVLASTYPRWPDDHEPSFVHELARRMVDRFEVVAIVPHAKGARRREVLDGVLVDRFRYAPAAMETLVNDGGIVTNLQRAAWKWLLVPGFIAMQWWAARRVARNAAAVHAHWIVPQGLIARLLGRPYLVTSHGADLFALRGRGAMALKRVALAKAARLTVVSEAMVEPAMVLSGATPVAIQPMGVDMRGRFTPDEATKRRPGHLLFVGRLVEKKGVEVLLRALPAVLSAHPGAQLTVVGHGPLGPSLQQLAQALGVAGSVSFVGPRQQRELPALYRSASLFVTPFLQARSGDREGLGLVLVEALACGCPVVSSDVPATRDVLAELEGVRRVPPADVDALAEALIEALSDQEYLATAALAARDKLLHRFDWQAVADGYADLIAEVMAGPAPRG
jgi:glycosyltransferase involved in cell wall biosynthesis